MGLFDHFPYTNVHELNLDWVLQTITECKAAVDDMEEWKAQHQTEYQELKNFMDNIEAGNFPDSMYEAMRTWLVSNAFDIIGSMIKFITVGLTDSGYFVVTIPENWSQLIFNTTGYDIFPAIQPEYGHLTISY